MFLSLYIVKPIKIKAMKKILLSIDIRHEQNKFWWDSGITNKVFNFDSDKETIHELIKEQCENIGMELTYKGKPQQNVFITDDEGNDILVGYIYRGKSIVSDRSMIKPVMVFWTIWATIRLVEKFDLVEV
jgi:hypothetical protein